MKKFWGVEAEVDVNQHVSEPMGKRRTPLRNCDIHLSCFSWLHECCGEPFSRGVLCRDLERLSSQLDSE